MQLLSVVPLARLPRNAPQVLSYTHTDPLPVGALVRISIGNRTANAIVINHKPLKEAKAAIKRLSYQLKPITEVLLSEPILFSWQLHLVRWMASHFYEPISLVLRTMLPNTFERRKTAPDIDAPRGRNQPPDTEGSLEFLTIPFRDRLEAYRSIITTANATLILAPDQRRRDAVAEHLDIPVFDVSLKGSVLFRRWKKIRAGETSAVVGTRSALMAPFEHLEHLIIEEESSDHHASWDQHPKVDLRTAAEWLAKKGTAVTVGDLLPTVKRSLRYDAAAEPSQNVVTTSLIDLRTAERDATAPTLSHALSEAIEETCEQNGTALLYVARRGAATFILCRDCGFHLECPHCSSPLVLHTDPTTKEQLRCHHCGFEEDPPRTCPQCRSRNIRYAGTGTQRVETELRERFPDAPILRLDADALENSNTVTSATNGILIGTDLLLSHPLLPSDSIHLAAAVSIETLLHLPDYTAGEDLFRTILKLRTHAKKQFIVQTYTPDASGMRRAVEGTTVDLLEEEEKQRMRRGYPPYTQLILCRYRHQSHDNAERQARVLRERLERQRRDLDIADTVKITGPAPAFIEQKRGASQWQLLLKWQTPDMAFTLTKNDRILRTRLLDVVPADWEIIVDPISLL